ESYATIGDRNREIAQPTVKLGRATEENGELRGQVAALTEEMHGLHDDLRQARGRPRCRGTVQGRRPE
ncbi:hypothetical protein EKO27_g6773, partial [Xylaria grammica]